MTHTDSPDLPDQLSSTDRQTLLRLARQAIMAIITGQPMPSLDRQFLSNPLRQEGTCFVTLTINGNLRGCIGGLEARQPLYADVIEHAMASATEDYRFSPVQPDELSLISIEISHLTIPQPLEYDNPQDLPRLLKPGIDGVVLKDGMRRATFLPQVWEKVPEPEIFLSMLCNKMGVASDTWKHHKLEVLIYHVEEFHE